MFNVGPDQLVTPKERYYLAIVFFQKWTLLFTLEIYAFKCF